MALAPAAFPTVPCNGAAGGGLALPTPSTLTHQQQLLQLQQQQLLQQQQNEQLAAAAVVRPLMRVGAIEPFPEKLHRMLTEVEQCGRGDVISFINNGRGFAIHKPGMSRSPSCDLLMVVCCLY